VRLYPTIPLWSQVDFISDKAPAREFRVSLEDIESGSGHLISGKLANYEAEGIPFESNDILFGKLRPYLAKFYQAKYPGTAGGDIHVYRPLPNSAPRFLFYVISSSVFIEYANISTTGVKMPRTDWITLRNFPTPNPPLDIQYAIADYLDQETSKINLMLKKLDNLSQLLKEWKQTDIESAFSNDSGHQHAALSLVANSLPGYAFPSKHFTTNESGEQLLRGINVKPSSIDWTETVWLKYPIQNTEQYRLREGDVVIGLDRPYIGSGLRCAKLSRTDEGSLLVQRVLRIRNSPDLLASYFFYAVQRQAFYDHLAPSFTGISVPHISEKQILSYKVPLPPPHEQERIVAHLDDTTANIDAMLAKTKKMKDILIERRSAVITAAVTGQIEVH
jgi:restriction modification system DNA specificity domain protein